MGKIFYLMGKSASGKDTIYKRLMETKQFDAIVLYTTRPIRQGETDGITYHFVDEARFQEMQKEGKVIEARTYQTVHGPWTYFTADDGQVQLEQKDYLVIGTLESFLSMQRYYGKEQVIPVYLELEDGIRLARALKREQQQDRPRYAELCRRFLADAEDFSEEKRRAAGICRTFCTEDGDRCLEEICTYIRKIQDGNC